MKGCISLLGIASRYIRKEKRNIQNIVNFLFLFCIRNFCIFQFPDFYKNESSLFSKNGTVLEFNQNEFQQILAQEKRALTGSKHTEEEGTTFPSDSNKKT